MIVQFIASIATITSDPETSRRLYIDTLGLPLTHQEGDDYYHSEQVGGCKHFGVWPLRQVAQACRSASQHRVRSGGPGCRHLGSRRARGAGPLVASWRTARTLGANRRTTVVTGAPGHRHLFRTMVPRD